MIDENSPIVENDPIYLSYRVRNLEQYVDILRHQIVQANVVISMNFETIRKYKVTIKNAIEYIDNNVLYECNYEENDELPMISDEAARNDLLGILKEVE